MPLMYLMHFRVGPLEDALADAADAHRDAAAAAEREVEALLGSPDKPEDLRHGLINTIAAWVIDHPDHPVDNNRVFAPHLRRLREAVFGERRIAVARLSRDMMILLREEGAGLDEARRVEARRAVEALKSGFGYDDPSAADAAVALMRERFHELFH